MIENNMFKTLFDIIPFGIYVADVENYNIVYMNKCMVEKRGDHIGRKCYESIYGEEKPCYFCKISNLLDNNKRAIEKTMVFEHFNAVDDRWYQLQEKCMSWPDGKVVKYSIAVNISELKETQNRLAEAHALLALKNKELEKLSVTDKLTQLCNRMKIEEVLNTEIEKAKRYDREMSVIIIDIDNFKKINDSFGHQVGDIVLQEFAKLIESNIRKIDYASRWGGEEFLLVCPETGQQGAKTLAENLRRIIDQHNFSGIKKVTCSIGFSSYKIGDDEKSIIRRADTALYRAKEYGRNMIQSS